MAWGRMAWGRMPRLWIPLRRMARLRMPLLRMTWLRVALLRMTRLRVALLRMPGLRRLSAGRLSIPPLSATVALAVHGVHSSRCHRYRATEN